MAGKAERERCREEVSEAWSKRRKEGGGSGEFKVGEGRDGERKEGRARRGAQG